MKKDKPPLVLSNEVQSNLRKAIRDLGKDVKREMTIAGLDSLKLSLDFDFNTTGKFMGVKINSFKFSSGEIVYDESVPD